LLNDKSRTGFTREEAARALGRIGGEKALAALEKALPEVDDESLAGAIRTTIAHAKRTASSGPR